MSKKNNKFIWHNKTLNPSLKRMPQRKARFTTESDIELDPIYTHEDIKTPLSEADVDSVMPGQYPYTRGIQPNMYRSRLWTMRQYAGYASAKESNRRYRYLLDKGQTGLSIAFDLPTQIGYDSDHPLARGEVGKVGVPISSLKDMEEVFEGIPLDKVSTSMTINATASVLLCLYIAVAKRQGLKHNTLRGTLQNDILKEYIARGTYIYPPIPSMRLVVDVFQYCSQNMPLWNTISVSGYHMREAGATAVQELAFTLSNGIAYVQAAVDAGLNIEEVAQRISFFFAAHNNLLEEVAKFRAARRMWAHIMRKRFRAKDPRSWILRFHTQTAGVTLTAQQPENNVVRTTIQALSAVLGGTQSLHVNSKDEALSLPTEDSAQLSLRTQQIIAHESGVADVVDPLGGSYFVEYLTNQLEEKASDHIKKIDDIGGALSALKKGYQVHALHTSAYKHQQKVEKNEQTIVGINEYQVTEPSTPTILRVDPSTSKQQTKRLQNLRSERDATGVISALVQLEEIARSKENTVPAVLQCVENYCTLGEICDVFRSVFGEQVSTLDF